MRICITCMVSLVFILAIYPACVRAQELEVPDRLTLEESIRLAIDRNPALSAAKNEIQAAEGDRIAANKRPNPALSLQAEDYPIRAHPGPFFGSQEIILQVDYEIERGGRRQLRTEAAAQAVEAQKFAYQNQIRLLRLEVERAFYGAVLAKYNLEAARLILDQVERMV